MAGVLDEPGALHTLDRADMLGAIGRIPEQLRDGWQRSRELELPERHRDVHSVAVLGMGGSSIAGDLVRAALPDRLRVPLMLVRDYEPPASVDHTTLVVASSHSGATEETVSALETCLRRRCPVAVITTGGPLGDVATRAGLPLLLYPAAKQPRQAVGYAVALLCGLLERAGLLELDDDALEAAAAAAQATVRACAADVPSDRNPAKALAWTLLDRLPVVEGGGHLAAVARRWKSQFNENGKTFALSEELPDATHNAVVGYAQPESLKDHLFVVFLASPGDHPRNSLRASLSAELLGAARIGHQVVPLSGEGPLAQAMAGVVLGDHVSTYLALLYGLDPTPVETISLIKARLTAFDETAQD